jgi:hypothetical protein
MLRNGGVSKLTRVGLNGPSLRITIGAPPAGSSKVASINAPSGISRIGFSAMPYFASAIR